MKLREKFAIPINVLLVALLTASLIWEWRRQEAAGMALLRTRLDEEVRFVLAARRVFGVSPGLQSFLREFCHAVDSSVSPEHQIALMDAGNNVVAAAAMHARHRLDPEQVARQGDGFFTKRLGRDELLIRVFGAGGWRVVVAESGRAVKARVISNLQSQAGWYLGAAVIVLGAANFVMRMAVLRPVKRISRAVQRLEQGHLGVEIERPGDDELGMLADQFNAMSRALAEHQAESERELDAAQRAQKQMLPPSLIHIDGLEVAGECRQKGKVGGDIYDVQSLPDNRVGILLADLSGHDVAAALHTSMLRAIVWQEAEAASSPAEVLTRLNRRLCRELPEEHFATAFFGWFDAASKRFDYASAGHPAAYFQSPDGTLRELAATGALLGIIPDAEYDSDSVTVVPDSLLLIYSDGLVEAANSKGDLWGIASTLECFQSAASCEPAATLKRIVARQREHLAGAPQTDDITIVVSRFDTLTSNARMSIGASLAASDA